MSHKYVHPYNVQLHLSDWSQGQYISAQARELWRHKSNHCLMFWQHFPPLKAVLAAFSPSGATQRKIWQHFPPLNNPGGSLCQCFLCSSYLHHQQQNLAKQRLIYMVLGQTQSIHKWIDAIRQPMGLNTSSARVARVTMSREGLGPLGHICSHPWTPSIYFFLPKNEMENPYVVQVPKDSWIF